jgi:hypothetical protein
MNHLSEFKIYLAEIRKGRNKTPYSLKVASDTVSRIRKIERLLEMPLSKESLIESEAFTATCEVVKRLIEANTLTVSRTKPAYPTYLTALRLYRGYLSLPPHRVANRQI